MSDPDSLVTTAAASARPPTADRPQSAVGLSLFGMMLFATNDVLGKWLVGTYSPWQVLLVRSFAALLVLAPLLGRSGVAAVVRPHRRGLHALRAAFSTAEVACFYFAVVALPLADVMAFYLAAPIFVAALSQPLLGERVGWRRWVAIVVGFAGVLICLKPSGSSLSLPSLLALGGAFTFSLMTIATRSLGAAPDRVLVIWQTGGALLAGLVISPFVWVAPSPRDLALTALLGIVALAAHMCINRALKLATAATVAPYQYTLIVWAIVLGYLVFGDVPTVHMVVGAGIIIASGLFIFWREQVAKRRDARVLSQT